MLHVTHSYCNLAEAKRLDAEYYVVANPIIKKFKALFGKVYKGQKASIVKNHFDINRDDIPDLLPALVILPSPNGVLSYKFVTEHTNKRYGISITSKSDEISVFDLIHFIDHSEVKNYLSLELRGSVIRTLPIETLRKLRIPLPKIQLAAQDVKNTTGKIKPVVNEFKIFISQYYQEYSKALKENQLVSATMLAGAISEAILYQVMIDCGVDSALLNNRGLGGLIRDVKLGGFNEIERQEFDLAPFSTLNNIRNDIVHPSRAIKKIKTDYDLIDKQEIIKNFDRIKRYFGL